MGNIATAIYDVTVIIPLIIAVVMFIILLSVSSSTSSKYALPSIAKYAMYALSAYLAYVGYGMMRGAACNPNLSPFTAAMCAQGRMARGLAVGAVNAASSIANIGASKLTQLASTPPSHTGGVHTTPIALPPPPNVSV